MRTSISTLILALAVPILSAAADDKRPPVLDTKQAPVILPQTVPQAPQGVTIKPDPTTMMQLLIGVPKSGPAPVDPGELPPYDAVPDVMIALINKSNVVIGTQRTDANGFTTWPAQNEPFTVFGFAPGYQVQKLNMPPVRAGEGKLIFLNIGK